MNILILVRKKVKKLQLKLLENTSNMIYIMFYGIEIFKWVIK